MAATATPLSSGPLTDTSGAEAIEALFLKEEGTPENAATETEEPEAEPVEEGTGEETEESEQTEEVEQQQPAAPELFTVKVDGKEERVTREELLNGYSRDADYRRKTMALADERKAVQAKTDDLRAQEAFYQQALPALQELLKGGPEPNWAELEKGDPIEFLKAKEKFRDRQEALQKVQAETQRTSAKQQAEQLAKYNEWKAAEQSKWLQVIPEWRDQAKFDADNKVMTEFALGLGFTPEEIQMTVDHRLVSILRKAALYEQLSKKSAAIKAAPPKVQTAKAGVPPKAAAGDKERALKRLSQTGDLRDAAAALAHLIPG